MSTFQNDLLNIIQAYVVPFRTIFTDRMLSVERNQFLLQHDYDCRALGIQPYAFNLTLRQLMNLLTKPKDQTFFVTMVVKYQFNIVKLKYRHQSSRWKKEIHIKFYSSWNQTVEEGCFKDKKDLMKDLDEGTFIASHWNNVNVMDTVFSQI